MTALSDLGDKVAAGERLADAEIEALASTSDLLQLGMLAEQARARRHGRRVTFVRVLDVALPDRTPCAPPLLPPNTGEARIVGTPVETADAVEFVRVVASAAGAVPVSGFSLSDLEALAAGQRHALRDLLARLRAAGLELIAEAPIDRLAEPEAALHAAAEAGLPVARVTIHAVPGPRQATLLRRAAALQDRVGGLRVLAPLAREGGRPYASTGYDDAKQVALARLVVDNISSIQVDWGLYGPKLSQVALTFGADDVDAVSPFDTLDLGARRAPLEEIRRNIRAASLVPVERNGRFQIVRR